MVYNALGRMVEQNRGGTYVQFVYDPTGRKLDKAFSLGKRCIMLSAPMHFCNVGRAVAA